FQHAPADAPQAGDQIRGAVIKKLTELLERQYKNYCRNVRLEYNVEFYGKIYPYGYVCESVAGSGDGTRKFILFSNRRNWARWTILRLWELLNGYELYDCSLEFIPWHYPRWPWRLVCRGTDQGGYGSASEFYKTALSFFSSALSTQR
ncbi:MAG: hypothetical protein QXE68_07460, partial [Sulfolobales archaeon]